MHLVKLPEVYENLLNLEESIGVVGLGYVGLPLSCLLAKKFKVIGYDINQSRIDDLESGIDKTREVLDKEELENENLSFTSNSAQLASCALIIITVPTPIDEYNKPDLHPILSASKTVGRIISPGTVVVFESTVFPGLTESKCKEIIEKESQMKHGVDFFLGYSPERVNPGDREHTISKIVKVVSGCHPAVTDFLSNVYGTVIEAGIFKAANIATAEASKVIENTQRDINIALINELSQIFERIGIDTQDVLEAARTKWNFLDFRPGLVGGHCIGVDPYYLTYLAEGLGIHSQTVLSGRRINNSMGSFIAHKTLKLVLENQAANPSQINIAIIGVTFKENVPDIRNTKIIDVAKSMTNFGAKVFFADPMVDSEEFEKLYGTRLHNWDQIPQCSAVIMAVNHEMVVRKYPIETLKDKLIDNGVIVDIKGFLPRTKAKNLGINLWRP